MWFVQPIADEKAVDLLRDLYHQDIEKDGYISNTTRAWSYRPELLVVWQELLKGIRSHLRLRTYELVTLAAARAIGCVY
ncbi:MAG TPA: hypothetical protein VF806_05180 [Anaerolineaceae bacterium]